ncbi:Protein C44B7.10, partial [Aphelenchoides avenae]
MAEVRECSYPIAGKTPVITDVDNAFKSIKCGDNIFVHGIAAAPTPLLEGLVRHVKRNDLNKITLHHLLLEGPTPWTAADVKDRIRSNVFFTGPSLRPAINDGIADFNSLFIYELPLLFRRGAIKLDAALIQVSPPDANGYCSLGTSVTAARAACTCADHIIAISKPRMPRTFGDSAIHSSHIDVLVNGDFPLPERPKASIGEKERKIGEIIADNLVDDGATLQMGIGAIPDAALSALRQHKDLGVHTEMFSDGILPLVWNNAITNAKKFHQPGRLTTSF